MLIFADVLEGDVTATPLRPDRHADPHIVQHGLLHGRALLKKEEGGEGTDTYIQKKKKRDQVTRQDILQL